MKKLLLPVFILMCYTSSSFSNDQKAELSVEDVRKNPGLSLNPQDLPLFFEGDHPLAGMQTFNLIPPLALKSPAAQKKLQQVIEDALKAVGEIIHLKALDMRGMGSGHVLSIQIGEVVDWDGQKSSLSRVSLQVETFVVISKTDIKTFPVVWAINSFFFRKEADQLETAMLGATQKLVQEFIDNYRYANPEGKPIFYTYY